MTNGRVIRIAILLSLLAGVLFWALQPSPPNETGKPQGLAIPTVLEVPSGEMLDTLQSAYRLKPDRRALFAVADVHHWFTGEPRQTATAKFSQGLWQIEYGGERVGSLPEQPDFSHFTGLLTEWVHALNAKYPQEIATSPQSDYSSLRATLDGYLLQSTLAGLKSANHLWEEGHRDAELLHLATRGLVQMLCFSFDSMQLMDPLAGKSLAMLAVTQNLTEFDSFREEALLASQMGYSAHAKKLAWRLRKSDPLRAYLDRENESLEQMAKKKKASTETKFLWLQRLAYDQNYQRWAQWFFGAFEESHLSLPLFKTLMDVGSIQNNRSSTGWFLAITLFHLKNQVTPFESKKFPKPTFKIFFSENDFYSEVQNYLDITRPNYLQYPDLFIYDPRKLTDQFESLLHQVENRYQGIFMESQHYRALMYGFLFSPLIEKGNYYLDTLSAIQDAKTFADWLGRGMAPALQESSKEKTQNGFLEKQVEKNRVQGGFADEEIRRNVNLYSQVKTDFWHWFEHLIESESSRKNLPALEEDLKNHPGLGGDLLFRTYLEIKKHFPTINPQLVSNAKLLLARLDSRALHQKYLKDIAYEDLFDLKLYEKTLAFLAHTDPARYEFEQVRYAYFKRDTAALKSFLGSGGKQINNQAFALEWLDLLGTVKPAYLKQQYRELIKKDPRNWYLRKKFVEYLFKVKGFREARRTIRDWQKLKVKTGGLAHVFAYNYLTESYMKQKLYNRAWKEISHLEGGQQARTLRLTGELQDHLGYPKDAETTFRFLHKRYPRALHNMLPLVKFLWRQGRHEEAGEVLRKYPFTLNTEDWRDTIGTAFSEIFSKQKVDKGVNAFSYLVGSKYNPFQYGQIAHAVFKKGKNPELAFKIKEQIKTGYYGQTLILLEAYTYLRKWKDEKQALAWLKKSVPDKWLRQSAEFIFQTRTYPLLWKLIEKPDSYTWLLRAASSLTLKEMNKDEKVSLMNHYNRKGTADHYHHIGRYLLGFNTLEALLSQTKSSKERCLAAYYIAYKAEQEERHSEAIDWYRVAVETGVNSTLEYRMGFTSLRNLMYEFKPVAQLGVLK